MWLDALERARSVLGDRSELGRVGCIGRHADSLSYRPASHASNARESLARVAALTFGMPSHRAAGTSIRDRANSH